MAGRQGAMEARADATQRAVPRDDTLSRVTALALALTSLALTEPAPSPAERGTLMVRLVDHYSYVGRRDRHLTSGLRMGLGAAQTGLGLYGAVSPDYTPAIRRAAYAQIGFGLSGIGLGLHGFVWRSPLERLAQSEELADLRADPGSTERLTRAEQSWEVAAKRAGRWRVLVGSGYLTAGVGVTAVGVVFVFSPLRLVSDDERFWAYSTLGTGLSLVLTGAVALAIRSPAERGLATYRAVAGVSRERRVTVRPTLGGAVLSGRF